MPWKRFSGVRRSSRPGGDDSAGARTLAQSTLSATARRLARMDNAARSGLRVESDELARCAWVGEDDEYRTYHDEESQTPPCAVTARSTRSSVSWALGSKTSTTTRLPRQLRLGFDTQRPLLQTVMLVFESGNELVIRAMKCAPRCATWRNRQAPSDPAATRAVAEGATVHSHPIGAMRPGAPGSFSGERTFRDPLCDDHRWTRHNRVCCSCCRSERPACGRRSTPSMSIAVTLP